MLLLRISLAEEKVQEVALTCSTPNTFYRIKRTFSEISISWSSGWAFWLSATERIASLDDHGKWILLLPNSSVNWTKNTQIYWEKNFGVNKMWLSFGLSVKKTGPKYVVQTAAGKLRLEVSCFCPRLPFGLRTSRSPMMRWRARDFSIPEPSGILIGGA